MGIHEALAAEIDALLEKHVGPLRRTVESMDREQDAHAKQIGYLLSKMGEQVAPPEDENSEGREIQAFDQPWLCAKCGARIGLYDEAQDILRIKYKAQILYIALGTGGFIKSPCRHCGEMNEVTHQD